MGAYTGAVYAFNRYTGELLWEADLSQAQKARRRGYAIKEVMEITQDTIYVFNYQEVYALNKADGSIRWKANGEDYLDIGVIFNAMTYDPQSDRVFVLDRNGVFALNA